MADKETFDRKIFEDLIEYCLKGLKEKGYTSFTVETVRHLIEVALDKTQKYASTITCDELLADWEYMKGEKQ